MHFTITFESFFKKTPTSAIKKDGENIFIKVCVGGWVI